MNPLHPTVPVEIYGRTFPLRFMYQDMAKAEWRLKMALVGPLSAEFWDSPTMAHRFTVLLYVGLLNCERDVLRFLYPKDTPATLTYDDVASLFDYDNASQLQNTINEALETFMPKPKATEAAATATPLAETSDPATTGTDSTPSLAPASA